MPAAWQDLDYDKDRSRALEERVRLEGAFAVYADRIARGDDHEAAHVATIRALIGVRPVVARSYGLGLSRVVGGERVARLGLALCLQAWGREAAAWDQLSGLDAGFLAEHAPVEAVSAALINGTDEANEAARSIVADPVRLDTGALHKLAGRFLVAGHEDVAQRLYDEALTRTDLDEMGQRQIDNLSRWLGEDRPQAPGQADDRVRLALFTYHHPGRAHTASNVGDHVQTLALAGNLARFQNVTFHGEEGMGDLMTELKERVRPELRIDGPAADVELVSTSRDFSEGDPVPDGTWLVAFGWHLHSLFRIRFGLPYHRNLRPIFVAFHLNWVQALTPEVVDYLKAHGPIGCRDWTTVDLLLSAGVDAFFTGCLTSTVNAVFPDRADVPAQGRRVVAAIDVPGDSVTARRTVEEVTHDVDDGHLLSLVEGMRDADTLLSTYLRDYHRIVTSRLHSYLPATSLGVPVTFRPKVPGDVRFAGLNDMEPEGDTFVAMRDGIRSLLADVLGLVVTGAGTEEVYARWREVTADRVAEAKERHRAPATTGGPQFDVARAVQAVRAGIHHYGPGLDPDSTTNVAVSVDHNYRHLLPVTLESLISHATGTLRIFVTSRGLDEAYRRWLSAAFPDTAFTFLDHDGVDYGPINRMLRHISVATMDRLLLAEVLPDVDRITYVDVDTVTLGDVSVLARTDLGGHPLAARTENYSATQVWRSAANHLDPVEADELRRIMAAAHPFDFCTFNAGVMVLDLDRMRRDRFVETYVPMATRFGLHDQDVLNAYTGAARAELDPQWNAMPVFEEVAEPALVHYIGAGKPWLDRLVPGGHHWRTYADTFEARVDAFTEEPESPTHDTL